MTTPIIIPIGDTQHLMVVGTSGKGRSSLLRRMEPTPEQKECERIRQEEKRRAEEERLNAVREAFWSLTPPGHHDFNCLLNVLVASKLAAEPTPGQVKAFFMLLPPDIVGLAISLGFGDTEVRENVYEFIRANESDVALRIDDRFLGHRL